MIKRDRNTSKSCAKCDREKGYKESGDMVRYEPVGYSFVIEEYAESGTK